MDDELHDGKVDALRGLTAPRARLLALEQPAEAHETGLDERDVGRLLAVLGEQRVERSEQVGEFGAQHSLRHFLDS